MKELGKKVLILNLTVYLFNVWSDFFYVFFILSSVEPVTYFINGNSFCVTNKTIPFSFECKGIAYHLKEKKSAIFIFGLSDLFVLGESFIFFINLVMYVSMSMKCMYINIQ